MSSSSPSVPGHGRLFNADKRILSLGIERKRRDGVHFRRGGEIGLARVK